MDKSTALLTVLGFVVSTASSFVLPLPSLVESSGHEIAARRAHRAAHGSPSPRMTTSPPSETRTVSSTLRERLWNVDPVVSRLPQPGLNPTGVQPNEKRGEARTDGRSPDFEVNLGRVISTLRNDYPRLFFDAPSFDIFTEDIELRDPTGVAFQGIGNYKRVFQTLRFFRQVMMNDASTTFRLTYDWSKQQVRVTWNMVLSLRARQRPVYVDGISVYHINNQGNANRHELETVIVNGIPVEPPFAYAWINLPAWVGQGSMVRKPVPMPFPSTTTSSYVEHQVIDPRALLVGFESEMDMSELVNVYRSNPDVREDFLRALTTLEATADATDGGAAELDQGGQVKDENAAAPAPSAPQKVRKIKQRQSWFGGANPLECDTSFDCTGGLVCCDFVLVKVCCSNGIRQPKYGDLIPKLVPIRGSRRDENNDPWGQPSRPRNGPW